MNALQERKKLKGRLPRTWGAFFERHGNFTPAQLAAIPRLLDGKNLILCARTASGKTEAAVAPLIERYCLHTAHGLQILYLTPTRALANDLMERLALPLENMQLSHAIKTRDWTTFHARHPSRLLITTPEAVDSLLTSHARVFTTLRAVILDELHLLDGTPRGDQLRVLLNRLRQIRHFAHSQKEVSENTLQFVALSATLNDPTSTAARYFPEAEVVVLTEKRSIEVEFLASASEQANELKDYLRTFAGRGWHKALVFCNTRAEVEHYAAAVRPSSPFGNAVYVHYSNIAPQRRMEIEALFAQDETAICFASSTLELGIDIGSIDVVILIGPPGDRAALLQRIGRGSRQKSYQQVACFYRSPLEELLFHILLDDIHMEKPDSPFRPAVAIQQLFSLMKQSPTGAIRINTVAPLFENMLSQQDVEAIVGRLVDLHYLQQGRPGEWKPDENLNQLFDEQNRPHPEESIYSNIQGSAGNITLWDQHTGQKVAQVDAAWMQRQNPTLEGRALQIHWQEGEAVWVSNVSGQESSQKQIFLAARQKLAFETAWLLPLQIGLKIGDAPLVPAEDGGWYFFHWMGDLYGKVLMDLLRYNLLVEETTQSGLCLWLSDPLTGLPVWTLAQIQTHLKDYYQQLEPLLALGTFHRWLPPILRKRTVIEQVNAPRFISVARSLNIIRNAEPSIELCSLLQ